MTGVHDSTGTQLMTYGYDDMGLRQSASRGNGITTSYGFDGASRLTSQGFVGSNANLSLTFSYNQAGQIIGRTVSNSAYEPPVPTNGTTNYTNNALNQTTSQAGPSGTENWVYDGRGNLSSNGNVSMGYDADNQLTSMSPSVSLAYDPLGRLYQVSQASSTRFLYFGSSLVGEYDTSGNVIRRYVPGAAADETLVWYEGSGYGDRRYLVADERGSVIAVTNNGGSTLAINTYDAYGRPGSGNMGRFQYTGQLYLAEINAYYYKARIYLPNLGKFAQADPSGYDAGMNLYAYAGDDPINNTDPSGLNTCAVGSFTFNDSMDWSTPGPQELGTCFGDTPKSMPLIIGPMETSFGTLSVQPIAMQGLPGNSAQNDDKLREYKPYCLEVPAGGMIRIFTWGGFDIKGGGSSRVPVSNGGPLSSIDGMKLSKQPYLNISHSWITFNRIPMPGDNLSFGYAIEVVKDQVESVDTPSGNYYVSNSVPNGVANVPSSGNTGVSITVCGH